MRPAPLVTFKTEAELCAAFIAEAERGGIYRCYPECCGWDVLAVRVADGLQIGIEAKLKLNSLVVEQAIEERPSFYPGGRGDRGPDFRAVLVPEFGGNFSPTICGYLGITIIRIVHEERGIGSRRTITGEILPTLPGMKSHRYGSLPDSWHDCCPMRREILPDYVPDSQAGTPCPITLTDWKIAAIKMAILLKRRVVTRSDFQALKIDHRRWLPSVMGWMAPADGRGRGWVAGPGLPDFAKQHPRNYAEIEAAADDWMPKPSELAPIQMDLGLAPLSPAIDGAPRSKKTENADA
ncbi:hypothetical protein [Beijerinckia sp. L45]|uniref:hypothetical protein n=1 Tax=Beijerinckia sp. L45 TaxID=1641855 RepID=UPI00131E2A2F|nr:hypothetical protein [Beijerinckia sp. L45]